MDHNQFKLMAEESTIDVEYIAELKKDLSEEQFNSLAFQPFSRFVNNEEIIAKIIELENHTWELSLILEMKEESWFSNSLLYLTRSFRSTLNGITGVGVKLNPPEKKTDASQSFYN